MPRREAGEQLRVKKAAFGVHTPGLSPGSVNLQGKIPNPCQSLFSHLETGLGHLGHMGSTGRGFKAIIYKPCLAHAGPR